MSVVATTGIVALANSAQASPASWDWTLGPIGMETVLTHSSGKASVGRVAGEGLSAIQTVTPHSSNVVKIPIGTSPEVGPNQLLWVVGTDDTIYAPALQQIGYNFQGHVVAYKDGQKVWDIVPPDTCTGQFEGIQALKLGADGNVYVVSNRLRGCAGAEFFLTAVDHTDGSIIFSISLGGDFSVSAGHLFAYDQGIAVLSSTSPRLRYYNYQGTLLSETAIQFAGGEWLGLATATHDGRVFALFNRYNATSEQCPWPWTSVSDRIEVFEPNGAVQGANQQPLRYTVQSCASVYPLATPNGGVVLTVRAYGVDDRLLALDDSLHGMWDAAFDTGTIAGREFLPWLGHDMLVDNNGNILTISQYWRQNQMYRGMQVGIFDGATGLRESVIYTDQLAFNSSFAASSSGIGLAQGMLYLGAHVCGSYQCNGSHPFKLFAIPVAELGMDYPRARVLGETPAEQSTRSYVALGDSFSAGEGVEPFISPSDSNGCHRSELSYAELLDAAPALNLNLRAFVACSGATTADVQNGKNSEPSQLEALSEGTDIVTITIGGNDIKFVNFAKECFNLMPDVHCDGSASHQDSMSKIQNELPGNLDRLFAEIQERIGPQTRVLVVGYPRMMPYSEGEFPNCMYLSAEEKVAIREVTNELNGAVSSAARRAGEQFEFVNADANLYGVRISPFAGHELCSEGAYFNGLSWPVGYSFHPNRDGQNAYAELVEDYLVTNP